MFPFLIKYKKILNQDFNLIENENILKTIKGNLKRNGVDRISISNGSILNFENDFFAIRPGLNWNIWEGISKGKIEIVKNQQIREVSYLFNTSRFFIIGLTAGVFIGIVSKMVWPGFFAFTVLGLLNWTISIIRHRVNFNDLLNEVLRNNKN